MPQALLSDCERSSTGGAQRALRAARQSSSSFAPRGKPLQFLTPRDVNFASLNAAMALLLAALAFCIFAGPVVAGRGSAFQGSAATSRS